MIIILGGITVLSFYSSYDAYHKPCHLNSTNVNLNTNLNVNKINIDTKYSTLTRLSKDKTPVNAYIEQDDFMMAVTGLDLLAAGFLLITTIVLVVDAREQAIQDDYVARAHGPY